MEQASIEILLKDKHKHEHPLKSQHYQCIIISKQTQYRSTPR